MKKIAFTLKEISNSSNLFYLLLLIPLFFSCSPEMYPTNYDINGSFDAYRQKFTGPSYSTSSGDKARPAYNLGGMVDWTPEHFPHDKSTVMNDYTEPGNQNQLHGPSAFYNASEMDNNVIEGPSKNVASHNFKDHLGFLGGIEFIQKRSEDVGTTISLNYLEVPLYALYCYQLPATGNIFGGVGPYFAYGIGGKMKSTYNGQTLEAKSFDKTNGFKPFDAGLSLTAGYKIYNSFSFRFAYDFGLANMQRNAFGDKTKNSGISLNVAYPLNKLIKKH